MLADARCRVTVQTSCNFIQDMWQPLLLSAGCIPALILLAAVSIERWQRILAREFRNVASPPPGPLRMNLFLPDIPHPPSAPSPAPAGEGIGSADSADAEREAPLCALRSFVADTTLTCPADILSRSGGRGKNLCPAVFTPLDATAISRGESVVKKQWLTFSPERSGRK